MKRRCMILVFIAVLCTFLWGCAKNETDEGSVISETAESEMPEGSEPLLLESNSSDHKVIEFSIEKDKPFDTLEEFIGSESGKKIISELTKNDEEGVFSSKVYSEGNNFILERQFSKDFNLWLKEDFLKNIKETVESKSEAFVSVVDVLESCIDQRNIYFCVRYTDPEGNVLFEKKFDNSKLKNQPKTSSSPSQESSAQASSVVSAVSSAPVTSSASSAA